MSDLLLALEADTMSLFAFLMPLLLEPDNSDTVLCKDTVKLEVHVVTEFSRLVLTHMMMLLDVDIVRDDSGIHMHRLVS